MCLKYGRNSSLLASVFVPGRFYLMTHAIANAMPTIAKAPGHDNEFAALMISTIISSSSL